MEIAGELLSAAAPLPLSDRTLRFMNLSRQIGPLLASVVALLALFHFWVPGFLSPANLIDLAQQISVNAILAFGMTLTILIGGIDLSVGALLALVGATTGDLLSRRPTRGGSLPRPP